MSGKMSARAPTRSRHFRGRARVERLDSRGGNLKIAVSSYPAAGYGCFKTKYPAVRNFRSISTERLILTF